MTYNLYIGANNGTGEVELDKLNFVLSEYFSGYTVVNANGYWNGKPEASVLVVVESEPSAIRRAIATLKLVLEQEAIGYQRANTIDFA